MNCNVCGRQTMNEDANFCEYCGNSFREQMHNSFNMPMTGQDPYSNGTIPNRMPNQGYGMQGSLNEVPPDKPVTFLNWLGTYGMMLIPIVGGIAFLVMLFIWAFGGKTPESKKNWARATLLFVGVILVIIIVYIIAIVNSSMFQQMMNGTFDYNSYYDSLYNQAK